MKRAPTRSEINAAEFNLAQAQQDVIDSLRRLRVAVRETLARPSTLAVVGGAAGLLGFWLARRPRGAPAPTDTARQKTTARGLILAFATRYAMQRLPHLLSQLWAGRQENAESSRHPVAPVPD
jgi:hypothetical protein